MMMPIFETCEWFQTLIWLTLNSEFPTVSKHIIKYVIKRLLLQFNDQQIEMGQC